MIPQLDKRGLLPVGIHTSDWLEIKKMFCWNIHRQTLFENFRNFSITELAPIAANQNLFLGGSFLSDKDIPPDIEGTLLLTSAFFSHPNMEHVVKLGMPIEHNRLMRDYQLDFYITLDIPGLSDFRDFFQYVGEKTAASKGLNPKDRRGIVQVIQWATG